MKAELGAQLEEENRVGRSRVTKKLSRAKGSEPVFAITEGLLFAIYSLGPSAVTANQQLLPESAFSLPALAWRPGLSDPQACRLSAWPSQPHCRAALRWVNRGLFLRGICILIGYTTKQINPYHYFLIIITGV